jgi:hypothetical protein
MLETRNRLLGLSSPDVSLTRKKTCIHLRCYSLQAQFGQQKARKMKARQAMLETEQEQAAVHPNMIEVAARAPVPMEEEKPKDPTPDVEWWWGHAAPAEYRFSCTMFSFEVVILQGTRKVFTSHVGTHKVLLSVRGPVAVNAPCCSSKLKLSERPPSFLTCQPRSTWSPPTLVEECNMWGPIEQPREYSRVEGPAEVASQLQQQLRHLFAHRFHLHEACRGTDFVRKWLFQQRCQHMGNPVPRHPLPLLPRDAGFL